MAERFESKAVSKMINKVIAADLFCGAGGTSSGLVNACKDLGLAVELHAINHWEIAIATHTANHPGVKHMCASLETVNPRKLFKEGKLELMWASPECMHHSVARGGKPINDQSRSTAWHVVQWAEALRPRAILVENVKEFKTWGPIGSNGKPLKSRKGEIFQSWIHCLEALGYTVEWKVLCAADYGDPTTRHRLFIQALRGKRSVTWPKPSHAPGGKEKNMFGDLVPWRSAREIIDWTLQGQSIFERKRPLSEKTMRRIWTGLEKFGLRPFIVPGQGDAEHQEPRTHDIEKPLPTVTAHGHMQIVQPFVVAIDQTGRTGGCMNSAEEPLSTITTKQRHAVVQPFLVRHQGQSNAESIDEPVSAITTQNKHSLAQPFLVKLRGTANAADIEKPLPTVTAEGKHLALAEPYLVQVNRTNGDRSRSLDKPMPTVCGNRGEHALVQPIILPQMSGGKMRSVDDPVPTITTTSRGIGLLQPYLIKYYGASGAASIDKPLDSQTTKQRFGLVRPVIVLNGVEYLLDILFRMLQPHELSAAQGFASDYKFQGTKTEIVKQIGNAVPVNLAKALCREVLTNLRSRAKKKGKKAV